MTASRDSAPDAGASAPPMKRGFSIAGFALQRRILVILVLAVAVLGGLLAARQLPSGIYPEVDFPRIGVVLREGGAPPEVFQTTITRPAEQALMTVLGVERVQSKTSPGGAQIELLFLPGTDMWRALELTQAALNDVRGDLPTDTDIHVERLTPVSFPILSFNVGGSVDLREIRDISDYTLRPALSRVHGVGRVVVLGGDVREMEVIVDPERAAGLRMRIDDVANRVRESIPLAAVGRFEQNRAQTTVMANAEAKSADDLAAVPIAIDPNGIPVPLGSIATVTEGAEDKLLKASGPKGETVVITVARLEGASAPEVVRDCLATIDTIRSTLPPGVRIEPVYDQGLLVSESIASVRDAILLGIALCLVVLGAFLRDVRAGLVAAFAVPITLAVTFLAMSVLNQTLNLMSLGGMAVSIGLVVDDAIVVVESIARKLELGASPEEAAQQGTDELSRAVIGTTVTTVIVFLPLAFLSGIVGKFFSALASTLASAVIVSLLVALLVVPIVAARFMRPRAAHGAKRFERLVGRTIGGAARHVWIGPVGAVLAIGFSAYAMTQVPTGFMPTCDEGTFVLDYFAPAGTSLSETDNAVRDIGRILEDTPEVSTFSARIGADLDPTAVPIVHQGDIVVRLRPFPRKSADEVIQSIRSRIESTIPSVRVEFTQQIQDMLNDLSGTPRPVEVKVFGEDQKVLERIAHQMEERISKVDGAVDVYGGVERPSSQLVVDVNRDASRRLGLSPDDVSHEVNDALLGVNAGTMRRFDRLIDIRVRYPDAVRFDPDRYGSLPISFGGSNVGSQSPSAGTTTTTTEPTPRDGGANVVGLSAVAGLRRSEAATVLVHENLQPVVILSADHEGRDVGSVARDIGLTIRDVPLPPGYRVELAGQYAGQKESSRNLAVVAGVGILLVLLVLVAQFGALRPALAILLTTPLALVGALGALWITHTPLNASSLMGCVLLVGLVVKNGILLVEVAEEHVQKEGVSYAVALALAGERRIRPILMTTLATLAGLAPLALALGAGAELQRPLAISVMGGLTLSSVLSLVVLPSLVAGLDRLSPARPQTNAR